MRTAESAEIDPSLDLEAVQEVLRGHPVQLAILFGSYATGRSHPNSDIDVAVELDGPRPSDTDYNETFFGLSADLSHVLETDDVDVVDLHTVPPELAEAIFERGILIVGEKNHADALRRHLTAGQGEEESPRERLDAALGRIDAHLGTGEEETTEVS
jgi:predicted nucleotidyltransferase